MRKISEEVLSLPYNTLIKIKETNLKAKLPLVLAYTDSIGKLNQLLRYNKAIIFISLLQESYL